MTFLETSRDFSSDRLWAIFRKKDPLRSKNIALVLVFLLPVVVQAIALLAVVDDPQALDPDGWVRPIIEMSAAFLPVMDKFLLGAPDLLPHAFSYLTGFFSGLGVLLVLMVLIPSAPTLTTMVKGSALQADKKGKSFKTYRIILLSLAISLIMYYGLFFGMAGTRNVVLYYEITPPPDLMRVGRIMRALLDRPLMHALFSGAAWGGAGFVWRYGLLVIGNIHRLNSIHSEWERFFRAQRSSSMNEGDHQSHNDDMNVSRRVES